MKILVADDDDASRTLLELMVSRMGYEVTSARDGLEALDALLSPGRPRLALLDWLMPGMEGPEICRRVRAAALEPYAYLVLVTSNGVVGVELARALRAMGCTSALGGDDDTSTQATWRGQSLWPNQPRAVPDAIGVYLSH